MPEIKQFTEFINPCYREEIPYAQVNYVSKNFKKGRRDPEYWWLLKENYNNEELQFA